MNTPEIYVVSAARTAIGTFGGSLKDVPPAELATTAVKAALERAAVDPALVGHLVMGNVIPTETRDAYISRVAAMNAGIPKETPAYNVNRLCGSGLQAIISAAQTLMLGDADIAIGAGAESMSRGPYLMPSARWGARMGNVQAIDYMLGILHDPFHDIHMGITAENVAERNGITREMQDALALEDQKRAAHAIANGYFSEQIATVEICGSQGHQAVQRRRAPTRHHPGTAGGDEAGVQEGRLGHRRQRLGPERRCGRPGHGHRQLRYRSTTCAHSPAWSATPMPASNRN